MKVTEVKIKLIEPNRGLIGFASVVLNGMLILNSIGIHEKLNSREYRLTYPTKKASPKDISLYHPLCEEFSKEIEKNVFKALKEVINNDRYSNYNS